MKPKQALTRLHQTVYGKVQNVGFRWFVKELADASGLIGWVRNAEDGTVELEVEGASSVLHEFESRMRTGNTSAKVENVVTVNVPPQGGTSFEIRR
jgi:acylphosphatase